MEVLGININLKRKDWSVLGILMFVLVVVGNLGAVYGSTLLIQKVIIPLTILMMSAGVYFTVRAKESWGGKMGRFLDLQAVAMTLLTYMWILTAIVNQEIALFGIQPGYWASYMYVSGAGGFAIAVYSFYLLNSDEFL
ncbi:MAG: hypothetical protein ABEK04_02610 [Candidatus Nanohalobium sp.]